MRLFVAIDIPDAIKEHLAFLQRSLELPGIKLVHPKNIHLTLNFLGEQDDVDTIKSLLATVSFDSFTLRLADIGYFPHERDPAVAFVGLEDNNELFRLQRQIDLHFRPDKSFKAHLTLGRLKRASPSQKEIIVKVADALPIKPLSFKVTSFKLYKSTLTSLGPVYEVLQKYKAEQ